MARPKKENAKRDAYRLRLDEEERNMLNRIQAETGLSIAEIMRVGIRQQYISVLLDNSDSQKMEQDLDTQK